jgi:hypothetical protein
MYDEDVPDMGLDKVVLTEFLDARFIKIVKETDDYTDIL